MDKKTFILFYVMHIDGWRCHPGNKQGDFVRDDIELVIKRAEEIYERVCDVHELDNR